jgi:uroporphyrin-III C-methyltransferase
LAAPAATTTISSPIAEATDFPGMTSDSFMGIVYLVGAGPGDPELLTMRGHRLLQRCDALVHDSLVPLELLELVAPTCAVHCVGKRRGFHSVPQPCTNNLLVELAATYRCVVRLKGGDPFLFGRGAEEAAFLVAKGVPVEVVPGVTAGIAVPAYAGIPVTHRKAGSSVTFVTGHEEIDKARGGVDWRGLARSSDGLVIYMGLHNLEHICAELSAGGLAGTTPAAIIQQGSVNGQKQLITSLEDLPSAAAEQGFDAPAIVVIGAVVSQRVPACAPMPAPVTMPQPLL